MDQVAAWQSTESGPALRSLLVLHFDIVRGCQLSCVGCPNSLLQPKVERISREDFATCLANIDVRMIKLFRMFNYGEPLLHRDLAGLLDIIPRQSWRAQQIELSTNAQFVHWPSFEAALATGVLTRLVVSCDGDGTPESYEALRPPSRWPVMLAFLEKAREIRDRVHPTLDLMTRTICTDPQAQARWQAILEQRGWRPDFRGWLPLPGSTRSVEKPNIPGQGVCVFQANVTQAYVDMDGSVVPCCAHPGAAILGNLKQERLSEILLGPVRSDFLASLATRDPRFPICASCGF